MFLSVAAPTEPGSVVLSVKPQRPGGIRRPLEPAAATDELPAPPPGTGTGAAQGPAGAGRTEQHVRRLARQGTVLSESPGRGRRGAGPRRAAAAAARAGDYDGGGGHGGGRLCEFE